MRVINSYQVPVDLLIKDCLVLENDGMVDGTNLIILGTNFIEGDNKVYLSFPPGIIIRLYFQEEKRSVRQDFNDRWK